MGHAVNINKKKATVVWVSMWIGVQRKESFGVK